MFITSTLYVVISFRVGKRCYTMWSLAKVSSAAKGALVIQFPAQSTIACRTPSLAFVAPSCKTTMAIALLLTHVMLQIVMRAKLFTAHFGTRYLDGQDICTLKPCEENGECSMSQTRRQTTNASMEIQFSFPFMHNIANATKTWF